MSGLSGKDVKSVHIQNHKSIMTQIMCHSLVTDLTLHTVNGSDYCSSMGQDVVCIPKPYCEPAETNQTTNQNSHVVYQVGEKMPLLLPPQKKTNFCFIDYSKDFDCVDHGKLLLDLK